MSSLIKIKACFFVIAGFILVIASVFIITTCKSPIDQFNTEDIYSINNIEEFEILLRKLPANTADKPYKILLNVDDLTGVSQPIKNNYKKYINIDLSGSNAVNIGKNAFYSCNNLVTIKIGNSINNIGEDAFIFCSNLIDVTIGNNVKKIDLGAFSRCERITRVEIPNNVASIGDYVFNGCIRLTAIDVKEENIVYCSVDGILYNKDKTKLIKYPEGKIGNYNILDSVTIIGNSAFYSCTGLDNVNIPNDVISIGDYAFSNCTSLTNIIIPDSVTSIGNRIFDHCTNLTNIKISKNVNSIEYNSFYLCTSLVGVIIPISVTNIRGFAFANCDSLTSVTFEGRIPSKDFSTNVPFPGDLRDKFYADDENNGTPGTYTREADGITWIRQP